MSDLLSLINRSLFFIGEPPILNPDSPETVAGKKLAGSYVQSRRETIRRYPWNWSEVWGEATRVGDPPRGYKNAYAFPENFIRLLWVGDPKYSRRDYRLLRDPVENRRIIAINNDDKATLPIGYSADVELLSDWDPLALKVLAIQMALDASKSVTGQDKYVALLNTLLTEELKDAAGVDGQEQAVLEQNQSDVQDARNAVNFGYSSWTNVAGFQ